MYDYKKEIIADIKEAICYDAYLDARKEQDKEEAYEYFYEMPWNEDSVTGNASGSYYCNAYLAEEAISHNLDLLSDALICFGCYDINSLDKGAEYCDVTIRCYLLDDCLSYVLNEYEDEIEESEAEVC